MESEDDTGQEDDEEDDEDVGMSMDHVEDTDTQDEVWRDASRSFPPLTLPPSSLDLLIPPGETLSATLAVYEALRFFSLPLKLTPFRLEDFCATLVAKDHNALLSSIVCALLRVLFKLRVLMS